MSNTLNGITLPSGLRRDPEDLQWQPVSHSESRTVGGGLIIQEFARTGEPMTLIGGDHAWILYSVLTSLRALTETPSATLALVWNGTTYSVMWRRADGSIEAEPVLDYETDDDGDWWRLRALRFTIL